MKFIDYTFILIGLIITYGNLNALYNFHQKDAEINIKVMMTVATIWTLWAIIRGC